MGRQVKGAASHTLNTAFPDKTLLFRWQEGYGVLTFGEKNLPFVQSYIEHQKQHHIQGTIYHQLERIDETH
jgi:putative transposase